MKISLNSQNDVARNGTSTAKITSGNRQSTAQGLINKITNPKKAKNYDLRFNWLKSREAQNKFYLILEKGSLNQAGFHSKKHPITIYQEKKEDFLVVPAA